MKSVLKIVLLSLAISGLALSQPTSEFTSPTGNDSLDQGWIILSFNSFVTRFFQRDFTEIRVMDGAYSTTVQTTIPLQPSESTTGFTIPFTSAFVDYSGDASNDLVLSRFYQDFRSAFRVVDPLTGNDLFTFDDPSFSQSINFGGDIDNDGMNELTVRREPFPPDGTYELIVYQTPGVATSVSQGPGLPPTSPLLRQNYPNPFNPDTRIQYELPRSGRVVLEIVDINGRKVRTFQFEHQDAGLHEIPWEGANDQGLGVASGVYFYRLTVDGTALAKKMILLR